MKVKKMYVIFLILCMFTMLTNCSSSSEGLEVLREKHPLYSRENSMRIETTSDPIAFDLRVKISDYVVLATIIDEPERIEIPHGSPIEDADFVKKYSSSDHVSVYLYTIEVNHFIAGIEEKDSFLVYVRERDLEGHLFPREGDKLYYLVMHTDGLTRKIADYKRISTDNVVAATSIFYATEDNRVLSIEDNEDMVKYDLTSTRSFEKILKDIWNEAND